MVLNINIRVNFDLYCTLSCELVRRLTILGFPVNLSTIISKSQALEIVYRGHAKAIEGAVGEGESVSWRVAKIKSWLHESELTKTMFLHSDFLKSLSSSLTSVFLTIGKLAL